MLRLRADAAPHGRGRIGRAAWGSWNDVVHGRFNLQGQGLQLTAQEHKILAFLHAPPRQGTAHPF